MSAELNRRIINLQAAYIRDLRDVMWAVAKAVETQDRELWDMALELCQAHSSAVQAP